VFEPCGESSAQHGDDVPEVDGQQDRVQDHDRKDVGDMAVGNECNIACERHDAKRSESMLRIQKLVSTKPEARNPRRSWSFMFESQNPLEAIVSARHGVMRRNLPAPICRIFTIERHFVGGGELQNQPHLARVGWACD